MQQPGPDTDELLARSAAGDRSARGQLLERHRRRLKRTVAVRLDRRLAPRVDPSDVVQEALAEAARRLDEYLRDRPMPYYPWLRRLAWVRLDKAHRRHTAGRRDVGREEPPALPDRSAAALADRLMAGDTGPADAAERAALRPAPANGFEPRRVALAHANSLSRRAAVRRRTCCAGGESQRTPPFVHWT